MYEIFMKLLEEKGVTAYKVSKATGIAGSTFTDWKTGRSTPKTDKLQKIADYFGVSLDYLMTGEETPSEKKSVFSELEEQYLAIARRMIDMNLSPEKIDALLDMIEGIKED